MNVEAFKARHDAFTAAARIEGLYRRGVNGTTYLAAATYLGLTWTTGSMPTLLVTIIAVAVVRAVGNAFVDAWASRSIQRIKAAYPVDGSVPPIGDAKP
jgi:hypothetical protein